MNLQEAYEVRRQKVLFVAITFSFKTSNNLSERSLRMIKCHEKVSGQFHTVDTARHFADIRTYLETCRRNHVNEFQALAHLTQGKPFTIEELLATGV